MDKNKSGMELGESQDFSTTKTYMDKNKSGMELGESQDFSTTKTYNSFVASNFSSSDCYINSKFMIRPEYSESENNSKDIINWGTDNLFPQQLLDLVYNNPELQTIVNKITALVSSKGFKIENGISSSLVKFYKNENGELPINKLIKKMSWDIAVFGGVALEIQWNKKEIGAVNHIELQNLRIALPKKDRPVGFYYCKNWAKSNKFRPIFIPKFDEKLDREEYPNQVIFEKYNDMGVQNYCLPIYYGAINEALLGWEISNFHLKGVRNGIYPNVTMTFFETPTQEKRREHYEKVNAQYGGTDNNNRVMMFYVADPTLEPKINVIDPVKTDEKFLELMDKITQKIITGFGITNPEVVGIPAPKGMNTSADETIFAMYRFQDEVIDPIQSFLEEILFGIAQINNVYEPIIINKKYTLEEVAILKNSFSQKVNSAAEKTTAENEIQQKNNNNLN